MVTKAVGDFLGTNGIADEMIKFNGYPFLEKEDHAFNVPGLYLSMGEAVQVLKLIISPSRESHETRLAYSSCLRYDPRCGNNVEQHGGERVPDRHERCSPDTGRVHWAAGSAVCNRCVFR